MACTLQVDTLCARLLKFDIFGQVSPHFPGSPFLCSEMFLPSHPPTLLSVLPFFPPSSPLPSVEAKAEWCRQQRLALSVLCFVMSCISLYYISCFLEEGEVETAVQFSKCHAPSAPHPALHCISIFFVSHFLSESISALHIRRSIHSVTGQEQGSAACASVKTYQALCPLSCSALHTRSLKSHSSRREWSSADCMGLSGSDGSWCPRSKGEASC